MDATQGQPVLPDICGLYQYMKSGCKKARKLSPMDRLLIALDAAAHLNGRHREPRASRLVFRIRHGTDRRAAVVALIVNHGQEITGAVHRPGCGRATNPPPAIAETAAETDHLAWTQGASRTLGDAACSIPLWFCRGPLGSGTGRQHRRQGRPGLCGETGDQIAARTWTVTCNDCLPRTPAHAPLWRHEVGDEERHAALGAPRPVRWSCPGPLADARSHQVMTSTAHHI